MYQNLNVTDPSLAQLYLMLEQADFDISSLADITPAGRDDGCCVVNMDPDLMGSITLVEGDNFELEGDVKIYPEELPKGNYQRSFLFHNPKGETAESGAVPFTSE